MCHFCGNKRIETVLRRGDETVGTARIDGDCLVIKWGDYNPFYMPIEYCHVCGRKIESDGTFNYYNAVVELNELKNRLSANKRHIDHCYAVVYADVIVVRDFGWGNNEESDDFVYNFDKDCIDKDTIVRFFVEFQHKTSGPICTNRPIVPYKEGALLDNLRFESSNDTIYKFSSQPMRMTLEQFEGLLAVHEFNVPGNYGSFKPLSADVWKDVKNLRDRWLKEKEDIEKMIVEKKAIIEEYEAYRR